jgi:hypothetical protein
MNVIHCTKKLQKEMGVKPQDLLEENDSDTILGSWHANLIYINRRKCVLFVNNKSLLNFIVPDVQRRQIQKLGTLFKENLECILAEESISKTIIDRILIEYNEIGYAKTNNKSVLGSMNDLALHYKYHIMESGGVHSYHIPSIISKLNRMPLGALKYAYPIEILKEIIEK